MHSLPSTIIADAAGNKEERGGEGKQKLIFDYLLML